MINLVSGIKCQLSYHGYFADALTLRGFKRNTLRLHADIFPHVQTIALYFPGTKYAILL